MGIRSHTTCEIYSINDWVNRGVNQQYVVKRLNRDLSRQQQNILVKNAETYLGKPYDIYFEWNNDAIYCSEIIWKAYNDALGIQLAPLQKLNRFDLSDLKVKALMKQRYGQNIPLQQTVIAPKAIFESKQLITVK